MQVQPNIHVSILTTEEVTIFVSASACTLKTSIAVKIIFNIVSVVEMIADYFAVFTDYNVATVGIVGTTKAIATNTPSEMFVAIIVYDRHRYL